MKLPNAENAIVPEAKITLYLLSETQEDGKHKAVFFKHFDFTVDDWKILKNALLRHVLENEVASILDTLHGKHYAIEGKVETPLGRKPLLRSIWAVDEEQAAPRFITAYPLKEPQGE